MTDWIDAISQYGIGGLIFGVLVYIIIKPMVASLLEANKHKQEYIEQLVNNHFEHDKQQHDSLMKAIQEIPTHIEKAVRNSLKR